MNQIEEHAVNDELVLYSYWRSSAAYRVRIALNLKQLAFEARPVHLVRDGGEQHVAGYKAINPQQLVPVLLHGRRVLQQSLAIIEYLDEHFPGSAPLLPVGDRERARVRALSLAVACDIHPIANLRVMQFLQQEFDASEEQRTRWTRHWIGSGFDAIETWLAEHPDTGAFCQGDVPSMADACLIPQVYNAQRFGVELDRYPSIARIHATCMALPAFQQASPEKQPDAPVA